jgi:hypothetical protein
MNIGDRVRVVHGTEEGVITKVLDSKRVEVSVDNDFTIPYLISELVLVSAKESTLTKHSPDETVFAPKKTSAVGLFLAFVPLENNKLELFIINNSELTLFAGISEQTKNSIMGLHKAVVKPKNYEFLGFYQLNSFGNEKTFIIQYFLHTNGEMESANVYSKTILLKDSKMLKKLDEAPVIGRNAYLFRIDEDKIKITAEEIKEKMFEDNTKPILPSLKLETTEVDLHIEMINPYHQQLLPSEKLKFQLDYFEKELSNAITANKKEIIFIHGVGAGVLKNEIARILSKQQNVATFKDAQKEKFGYGATLVILK